MVNRKLVVVLVGTVIVASLILILYASNAPETGGPSEGSSRPFSPSPQSEIVTTSTEGAEVKVACDAVCGDWIEGSCVFGQQYFERLCACEDSGQRFYESATETANC